MKSVIIGFSKPIKFLLHAKIIMLIDQSNFDHAYVKFHSDSLNRDIIYQSNWRGVEFIGATLFNCAIQTIKEFEIEIDDEKYISLMQFCVDNAGISYSFLGVLALGITKILNKIGISFNNLFHDGLKTEFCSEIVYRCLDDIDPIDFHLDAETISPKDLYNLLKQLNIKEIK